MTWIQFQVFVNDPDGYGSAKWWEGLEKRSTAPEDAQWSIANHPREKVDWDEAVAFGRWLTVRLRAAGMLSGSEEARLPTEEEWERAARGPAGRQYPWGDGYHSGQANINETWEHAEVGELNLGRTSAVGMYADGATPAPEGVHDMAGNVWEWCLNEYHQPDRIQVGGTAARVVRGGSWYNGHDYARASFRDRPYPGHRFTIFGFRLVVSSPVPALEA